MVYFVFDFCWIWLFGLGVDLVVYVRMLESGVDVFIFDFEDFIFLLWCNEVCGLFDDFVK